MRSYDDWKATEPPDSTPWQECKRCGYRGYESSLFFVERNWLCGDCWAELTYPMAEV